MQYSRVEPRARRETEKLRVQRDCNRLGARYTTLEGQHEAGDTTPYERAGDIFVANERTSETREDEWPRETFIFEVHYFEPRAFFAGLLTGCSRPREFLYYALCSAG